MDLIISRYIIFLNLLQNLVLREHIQHFSKPKPKIEYNWWQRLWRIHKFLQRSRKKKKQAQKDKRNKRKQEKKFNRRKKWRKYKVVIKSIFKRKKKTSKELATIKKRSFLAKWKRRRRRRIIRVFIKSIGKTKKMTKARIEYIQRYEKEKAFNKYRKKRRRQFIIKRNLLILKNLLTGKGLPPKRYKKAPSPWRQIWLPEQLTITANSLMFFLLSYFFIAFFDKLATGLTSYLLFDYKTIIYYYKIEFLVDNDAWFTDSVKTIFATGPILGLMIAILSLIIYSIVYLESGILKTLLLWAIFHGFNRIVNGTLIGAMIGEGFGYVIMYMYYSDTGKLIMSLLTIITSVIIGTISTKYWIMTANSYYNYSKTHNRQVYIYSQVLLPFILGNVIIYLINLPEFYFYDIMVNGFMLFMILPVLILNKSEQDLYFDEDPKTIKLSVKLLIFSIVFIGTYRILLDIGIRIG